MKVKAVRAFKDVKDNIIRHKGDVFIVNKKRYEEINSTSFGILVEEVSEDVKDKESG